MSFPSSSTFPVRWFLIEGPEDLRDFTIGRFRDLLDANLSLSRMPASLTYAEALLTRWAFIEDTELIHLGDKIAFLMRTWTKKPHPSLSKAMLAARMAEWCSVQDRARCPRAVKAEIKETVDNELLVMALPVIHEDAILIDVERGYVALFNNSDSAVDLIRRRVCDLLTQLYRCQVHLPPVDLERTLLLTRPHAVMASNMGPRFLSWLVGHAVENDLLRVEADGIVRAMHIELADQVQVARPDGKLSAKGGSCSEALVRDVLAATEGMNPATGEVAEQGAVGVGSEQDDFAKVQLVLRPVRRTDDGPVPDDGSYYTVTIDDAGRICSAKTMESSKAEGDGLDAEVFLRAEEVAELYGLVQMLYAAFDVEEVARLLGEAPQVAMFPGSTTAKIGWGAFDLAQVTMTARPVSEKAAPLPVRQTTMTISTQYGGSVTVTAKAAAKAAAKALRKKAK